MAYYQCGNCGMPFQTTDDAVSVNCPRCGAYQLLRGSDDVHRDMPGSDRQPIPSQPEKSEPIQQPNNAAPIQQPEQEPHDPASGRSTLPFDEDRAPESVLHEQAQSFAQPAMDHRYGQPAIWQEYPGQGGYPSVPPKQQKSKKGLIIGIIAGVVVIALAVAAIFLVPKWLNIDQSNGGDGVRMEEQNRLAVSDYHIAALKKDGTVISAGDNENGQCEVAEWTDIAAIASGTYHTVGLKSDGTVVATAVKSEQFDEGQSKVEGWKDLTAIAAGQYHTVGLKKDGTVVATGSNDDGQCDVGEWTDITAISAKGNFTVGLKKDGTVVAAGENDYGQCEVTEWTDITTVSAGKYHTVGLKSDGTVVCTSIDEDDENNRGQCDVAGWTDITAISAGKYHTVGLKNDGTVICTPMDEDDEENKGQSMLDGWTDVTAISAGVRNTVALKSDGTLLTAGDGSYGQTELGGQNVN